MSHYDILQSLVEKYEDEPTSRNKQNIKIHAYAELKSRHPTIDFDNHDSEDSEDFINCLIESVQLERTKEQRITEDEEFIKNFNLLYPKCDANESEYDSDTFSENSILEYKN